ncbi:MAG: PIN domain-containing protein [Lautropia sp.]|nr:PIN domain-containing protein [Lautropia sp.]
MKVALDTNVLVYAQGINSRAKQQAMLDILRILPDHDTLIPVQVLGELFNVLVRKAGLKPDEAKAIILEWQDHFSVIDTSAHVVTQATELASMHQLGIWDAVILSAASSSGCRVLLSEDMQHGFTWSGTTVVNPFHPEQHPLLAAWRTSLPRQ